jgi:SNF2 family DNA or RNA helicase
MRRLQLQCEVCGKTLKVLEEIEILVGVDTPCTLDEMEDESTQHLDVPSISVPTPHILQILKCGHNIISTIEIHKKNSQRNLLWDRLLPFQQEFVEFAEANNCRAICRDQMGMGKTIESLSVVINNMEKFTDNFTKYCLIVTPVGSIYNWEEEALKWFGLDNPSSMEHFMMTPQVVITGGQLLTPLSKVVICPWSKLSDKKIQEQLLTIGIASIIVDECHFFKDEKSQRTSSLLKLVRTMAPESPLLFLSGTLVENRIMEMKVALNLLDPKFFYSWEVLDRFCSHSREGKALSLSPYYRDRFFARTSKYMIGRKKEDVNLPLPTLKKSNVWTDPQDFKVNEDLALAYNKTLDEMEVLLSTPAKTSASLIGLMQQLRHITGKMKILGAATFIENFFIENPGEKLAVGIHHISVRESLAALLSHRNPLQMSDEDPKRKDEIERGFRNGESNLLICSILSAGVGRNFQFCKNALIVERQWNRSKEDQFTERFHRILTDEMGRVKAHFTEKDDVTVWTMQGKNTFDEFFDPLIHLKGIIVDSSEESTEELPEENFILELAEQVVAARIKWVG